MATLSPELLKLVKSSKNKHSRAGKSVSLGEGKTTIRVLAKPDGSQFWEDLGVHWIKTEVNGKPVAVVGCHDEVYGKPCPICTAIAKATEAATSDDEIKLIKEWKASKTVLVNALVRSGANKSEEPQVVELKSSVWGQISGMIAEYMEADVDLLDLEKGQDFVVERRGRGIDTKYTVMLAPKSAPVDKNVLDGMHDLKAWIESQFFRGEETKALTTIAQVTGVNVSSGPALAAPPRSALLTKPAAVVEDAEVAEIAETIVEAEEIVEAGGTEEEDEAALAEAEAAAAEAAAAAAAAKLAAAKLAAAKKAAAAKVAPATAAVAKPATVKPTAKAAPATAPADDFNADMAKDEIDSLLADLDS